MIFSRRGAKSKKTAKAISKLANKIANKTKEQRHAVSTRINTDLSFILIRLELICLRGSRRKSATNFI